MKEDKTIKNNTKEYKKCVKIYRYFNLLVFGIIIGLLLSLILNYFVEMMHMIGLKYMCKESCLTDSTCFEKCQIVSGQVNPTLRGAAFSNSADRTASIIVDTCNEDCFKICPENIV